MQEARLDVASYQAHHHEADAHESWLVRRAPISSSESADLSKLELDQVHRAVRFAMAVESAQAMTPPDLSAVDAVRFAHAVERHRLEVCLAQHLEVLNVPAQAVDVISARAVAARMSAMAVAAVSIEVSKLLSELGIRALIFKGCALAVQTTGDFTARGAGDVDVLVHPDDVEAAVRAFERIRFRRGPYLVAKDFGSRQWQYARWATCELTLSRGKHDIDLHWCLTNVRSSLPAFDDLWQRRDYVGVNSTPIPTLDLADALDHSCAHALKDHWRWIRSLVDIDRLARQLHDRGHQRQRVSRAVQLSTAVAFEATRSRYLLPLATKRAGEAARARQAAARAQCSNLMDSWDRWTPQRAWRWQRQQTALASTARDWMRHIACYVMSPSTIIDPVTGEGLSVAAACIARARCGLARLAGGPGKATAVEQPDRPSTVVF